MPCRAVPWDWVLYAPHAFVRMTFEPLRSSVQVRPSPPAVMVFRHPLIDSVKEHSWRRWRRTKYRANRHDVLRSLTLARMTPRSTRTALHVLKPEAGATDGLAAAHAAQMAMTRSRLGREAFMYNTRVWPRAA